MAGTPPVYTMLATLPPCTFAGSALVQGTDGNFYGISAFGSSAPGYLYRVTPQGVLTTIYNFCSQPNCTDGTDPQSLVLGTDGNFYGTTGGGGAYGSGTFYKVTTAGALTTLYSFEPPPSADFPCGDIIQGNNGDFYGTTGGGTGGYGAIVSISPAGTLSVLYNFTAYAPSCASLLQAANGSLYGTSTQYSFGSGAIYELTLAGTFSTVVAFDYTDGSNPMDGLIQTADGNFYGTTSQGGANGAGTVFQLAPNGTLTTLHSFGGATGGYDPVAPLVYASNGKFYGTTLTGEGHLAVGIFEISSDGAFHSFKSTFGGNYGLVQGTDGVFYQATEGDIYSFNAGLPPFVKTVPLSGPAGTTVMILGTDLTGTTSVTFNGVAAALTVVSATEITATIPAGATTGKVQVITPKGKLTNVGQFIVTP